jgi:hypothetical protein
VLAVILLRFLTPFLNFCSLRQLRLDVSYVVMLYYCCTIIEWKRKKRAIKLSFYLVAGTGLEPATFGL